MRRPTLAPVGAIVCIITELVVIMAQTVGFNLGAVPAVKAVVVVVVVDAARSVVVVVTR